MRKFKLFIFQDFVAEEFQNEYFFSDSYFLFLRNFTSYFREVTITSRVIKGEATNLIPAHTVSIFRLKYDKPLELTYNPKKFFSTVSELKKECENKDILFLSWPHPISVILALIFLGKKTIVFCVRQNINQIIRSKYHGVTKFLLLFFSYLVNFIRFTFFNKQLYLTFGEEVYEEFNKSHHYVFNVKDTIDLPNVQDSIESKNHGKDYILFVGRLEKEKGLINLIKAFKSLSFLGKKLIIVGSGSQSNHLKNLVEKLNLNDIVFFLGHIPFGFQLSILYKNASLLVIPSFTEGYPKVILEAQQFSLPILASNVGGIKTMEHINSGVFKVATNSPEILKNGILEVFASDSSLLYELQKFSNLNYLKNKKNWTAIISKRILTYHETKPYISNSA
ncbi:MAG: glycosyltransferase [Schleiferiaceae bacterium]|nr:glycosyltransferase [Schleiferiaceae bacterium]